MKRGGEPMMVGGGGWRRRWMEEDGGLEEYGKAPISRARFRFSICTGPFGALKLVETDPPLIVQRPH